VSETCAKCGNQTVAAHSITLDGSRRLWRLCCLCTAELVNDLNSIKQEAPDDV